jgi:hypothetical protein
MATSRHPFLFRRLEPAYRTQYAEVRERSRNAGPLLPGTPGLLTLRSGTGYRYWYRRYNNLPNQEAEDLVCKEGDDDTLQDMRAQIEFAAWSQAQVRDLRRLGLHVADKDVSRRLVELHNKGLFAGGVVVVGTLAFTAWLNEFGAIAASPRTQDIDLAQQHALKLGAPLRFLDTVQATKLRFFPIPGLPNKVPSTSLKRRGAEGLRVDVLTHGKSLGAIVPVPELSWHAQTVPHFDYLLGDIRQAAVLAAGHCIPVNLPSPERFVWHKLYSSTTRVNDPTKARKDFLQAATLASVLVEQDDASFEDSVHDLPRPVLVAARKQLPQLREQLKAYPQALDQFERGLR